MSNSVAFNLGFTTGLTGQGSNPYVNQTQFWKEWNDGLEASQKVKKASANLRKQENEQLSKLQSQLFALEVVGTIEDCIALREKVEQLQIKLSKS